MDVDKPRARERKARERARGRKRELRVAQAIFDCSIRQFERMASQEDPVMRYRLPMELLRISNDVALTMAKMAFQERTEDLIEDILLDAEDSDAEDKEETLAVKMEEDISTLRQETEKVIETILRFQTLMDTFNEQFSHWVSTPHYSPDQILGKKIMKDSHTEFECLTE